MLGAIRIVPNFKQVWPAGYIAITPTLGSAFSPTEYSGP